MTLARGDKVVKLGNDGKPLTLEQETYIEYEIIECASTYGVGAQLVFALLKKLR